jgi:p-cumate 2,3-dioxygenase beta subunit
MSVTIGTVSRAEYEDFLFNEAALLDEWRLDEWLALFAEGATYEVPPAGAPGDVDSAETLFYIADDWARLQHRVKRLQKEKAHAEYPHSKGLRLISNVRILGTSDGEAQVGCAFVTYRSKNDKLDQYFGHHRYVFRVAGGALKIAAKRSFLDMSNLRQQGRVSIIL